MKWISLTDLERAIDQRRLNNLLDDIAQVCERKAEHIQTEWKDDRTSQLWAHVAKSIATVADSPFVRLVSN